MRILIIGFAYSIHTARWIEMINDQGWDIHLFPSCFEELLHKDLKNITLYQTFYAKNKNLDKSVKRKGIYLHSDFLVKGLFFMIRRFLPNFYRKFQIKKVTKIIKKIKPDIVHSFEFQQAGYLINEVYKKFPGKFPKWLASNWGSDIYLFGQLKKHKERIREVLESCNFYLCESERDQKLAKKYGLKGKTLPIIPAAGGHHLEKIQKWKTENQKERTIIMLKGYQGWAGRALVGLRALERCSDLLKNYKIVMYSISSYEDMEIATELFSNHTGIEIELLPPFVSHEEIMKLHGKARISLGLSISDGLPASFLEAMSMGAFPIQSWTSTANEWVEDGKSAFLVPPEDPEIIERAIRKALTNDTLTKNAALINWKIAQQRLDFKNIKKTVIDFYKTM